MDFDVATNNQNTTLHFLPTPLGSFGERRNSPGTEEDVYLPAIVITMRMRMRMIAVIYRTSRMYQAPFLNVLYVFIHHLRFIQLLSPFCRQGN